MTFAMINSNYKMNLASHTTCANREGEQLRRVILYNHLIFNKKCTQKQPII